MPFLYVVFPLPEKLLLRESAGLIVDDITYDIAGKRVEDNLTDTGIDVHVLRITGATMEAVEKARELYHEINAQFSVAVGGGTVIDVAKYSSFKENIPFVSVPTVASHDGISSARASIKSDNRSFSYEARPPTLVIGDVETAKTRSVTGGNFMGGIRGNPQGFLWWHNIF